MEALADSDLDRAMALLDEDVVYTNVGLPSIRGRDSVAKALGGLQRPSFGFEVYLHAISADGPVVLTERTDVLVLGSCRTQFWVWGRFDVHDGRITLWRDSFDFVDVLRARSGAWPAWRPRRSDRPPPDRRRRRALAARPAPGGPGPWRDRGAEPAVRSTWCRPQRPRPPPPPRTRRPPPLPGAPPR